jgi:hypothetical protein
MKMAELVYVLCGLTSAMCAIMLYRKNRRHPSHLLFWSALSFSLLALNNVIFVVDMVIMPDVDFGGLLIRNILSASAGTILLFGLIWEVV